MVGAFHAGGDFIVRRDGGETAAVAVSRKSGGIGVDAVLADDGINGRK